MNVRLGAIPDMVVELDTLKKVQHTSRVCRKDMYLPPAPLRDSDHLLFVVTADEAAYLIPFSEIAGGDA